MMIYITEQYSLTLNMLFVNEFASTRELSELAWDTLFGLAGRDEGLDDEGRGVLLLLAAEEDLLADLLAELGVFLLLALLIGVLESCSLPAPPPMVKLSSLMGETLDLLFAAAFFEVDLVALGRLRDFEPDAVVFFLIEAGVVLAFDDLGLGVPLLAFDALLAGVGVCLAIVDVWLFVAFL